MFNHLFKRLLQLRRQFVSMLEWSCSVQMAGFRQILANLLNKRQSRTPDHLICKRADDAVISELPEMHNAGVALHSSASYPEINKISAAVSASNNYISPHSNAHHSHHLLRRLAYRSLAGNNGNAMNRTTTNVRPPVKPSQYHCIST